MCREKYDNCDNGYGNGNGNNSLKDSMRARYESDKAELARSVSQLQRAQNKLLCKPKSQRTAEEEAYVAGLTQLVDTNQKRVDMSGGDLMDQRQIINQTENQKDIERLANDDEVAAAVDSQMEAVNEVLEDQGDKYAGNHKLDANDCNDFGEDYAKNGNGNGDVDYNGNGKRDKFYKFKGRGGIKNNCLVPRKHPKLCAPPAKGLKACAPDTYRYVKERTKGRRHKGKFNNNHSGRRDCNGRFAERGDRK